MAPLLAAGTLLLVIAIQRPNAAPGATAPTPSFAAIDAPGTAASATGSPAPSVPAGQGTPLPSVGGTCASGQIAAGASVPAYGYGAAGTTVAFLTQELRNSGADCILAIPAWIGVVGANGQSATIPLLNVGAAGSRRVGNGEAITVVLQATWSPSSAGNACEGAIADVSNVELPLATGRVELDTGIVWKRVCASPPNVTIKFKD